MNQFEEGCKCPACNEGEMGYPPVKNCSCHLNPPCGSCVDNRLKCDSCGFEEPEREDPPPMSQVERDKWAKYMAEWESTKQRGTILPSGGRIFNVNHDGSSGSTMVFTGQYEGPVTASEIFAHLGDGTFGHRGPSLGGGRFTYTKITD